MPNSFAEVRLPTAVALGFTGGPEYSTDVVVLFSGRERRNQNRQDGRASYTASYDGKTRTVTDDLVAFFRARRGKFQGFRFKDHIDYQVDDTEGVLTSLGFGTYQLWKRYTSGGVNHDRKIIKPVSGTVVLKQGSTTLTENTHYSLDYTTGIVNMLGSPGFVPNKWSGDFDVPVRFDTDKMEVTVREPGVFDWGNIGLVELLEQD